jgi:hypothetical protein
MTSTTARPTAPDDGRPTPAELLGWYRDAVRNNALHRPAACDVCAQNEDDPSHALELQHEEVALRKVLTDLLESIDPSQIASRHAATEPSTALPVERRPAEEQTVGDDQLDAAAAQIVEDFAEVPASEFFAAHPDARPVVERAARLMLAVAPEHVTTHPAWATVLDLLERLTLPPQPFARGKYVGLCTSCGWGPAEYDGLCRQCDAKADAR